MGADVEFLEFDPDAAEAVLAVMDELAGGGGWVTLDPAIDERFPPPARAGRLKSGATKRHGRSWFRWN